eukprot:jgi/Tetstr1/459103/TSEL_004553.t1
MPGLPAEAAGAVQAIDTAGENIEKLAEAIDAAQFLDNFPGDERQKLRAARRRLKELTIKAQQDAALGIRSGPGLKKIAEVSPWKKPDDVYESKEFDKLCGKYESLKWRIISKPGGATMKQDSYYVLYGFEQQATKGDVSGERPMWAEKGGIDFDGREKWDHWKECIGMEPEQAKMEFVRAYYEFSAKDVFQDTRFDD